MKKPEFKPSVIEKIEAETEAILRNQLKAKITMAGYSWDVVMGLNPKKGQPNKKELPSWLYKLAIEQNPSDPEVNEGILKALDNREINPDEYNYLKRITDESSKKFTNEEARKILSKTETHLLNHWFSPTRDWQMCLCFYNDSALTKLLDFLSDVKVRRPRDTVVKTYKRLNLKKASVLLFKDIQIKGEEAIPVPYQNLLV